MGPGVVPSPPPRAPETPAFWLSRWLDFLAPALLVFGGLVGCGACCKAVEDYDARPDRVAAMHANAAAFAKAMHIPKPHVCHGNGNVLHCSAALDGRPVTWSCKGPHCQWSRP